MTFSLNRPFSEEERIFQCSLAKTCIQQNRCRHSEPHRIDLSDCGIFPSHICAFNKKSECIQVSGPVSEYLNKQTNIEDCYSTPLSQKVDRITTEEYKKIKAKRKAKRES
jgi:hypothetical protein